MFYYIDELSSIAYRQAIEGVAQMINFVLETEYSVNDWVVLEEISRRLGIAYDEKGKIVSYMPNFKEDVMRALDSIIGVDTAMDRVKFNTYLKDVLESIRKNYMIAYGEDAPMLHMCVDTDGYMTATSSTDKETFVKLVELPKEY